MLLLTTQTYANEELMTLPIKQRPADYKAFIHEWMAGARLSAIGNQDDFILTHEKLFEGSDYLDFLFIENEKLPRVVYVSGQGDTQLNHQYHKLTQSFGREEVVILFFDKKTFFERESGFIVNHHLQFLRARQVGRVISIDYDPIEYAYFRIELGKRLGLFRPPRDKQLCSVVTKLIKEYMGARLAEKSA